MLGVEDPASHEAGESGAYPGFLSEDMDPHASGFPGTLLRDAVRPYFPRPGGIHLV